MKQLLIGSSMALVLGVVGIRAGQRTPAYPPHNTAYGTCNQGGLVFEHLSNGKNVGKSVDASGRLVGEARCEDDDNGATKGVKSVEIFRDCGWPATGPTWKLLGKGTIDDSFQVNKSGLIRYKAEFSGIAELDGRGAALQQNEYCQIKAVVSYNNGVSVPNYVEITYFKQ